MTSHLGLYGVCSWNGAPFLDSAGNLIPQVVADHARWPVVILEATPLLQRPDIAVALKAAGARVIAFVDLEKAYWSPGHSMDPANDLTRELYEAAANVPAGRGFVWSAKWGDIFDPIRLTGRPVPPVNSYSWYGRNLACPECVEATARVIIERVMGSGLFQGVFFDLAQQSIAWTSSDATDVIDFRRAGFASLADFDAAYRENHRYLFRLLHDAAPDGFSIMLNAWPDPTYAAYVNGYLVENFVTAPGDRHDAKAWLDIMQALWAFERNRGADAECWINQQPDSFAWEDGVPVWTVENNAQAIAFGLGSALLTDSARFTMSMNGRPNPDGRERRWAPVYDFVAGLGAPLGPACRMIPLRGAVSGCWTREYASGSVVVDPVNRWARFYERAA